MAGIREIERAAELLRAAAKFIKGNDLESYEVFYDDATCDGECLRGDMLDAAEDLLPAGAAR